MNKILLTVILAAAIISGGCSKKADPVDKDINPDLPPQSITMTAILKTTSNTVVTLNTYHYQIAATKPGMNTVNLTKDGFGLGKQPTLNALDFLSKVSDVDTASVHYLGDVQEIHVCVPNFELKPGVYTYTYGFGNLDMISKIYVTTKGARQDVNGSPVTAGFHEFAPKVYSADYSTITITKVTTYPYKVGGIVGRYYTINGSFDMELPGADASFIYDRMRVTGTFTNAGVIGYD